MFLLVEGMLGNLHTTSHSALNSADGSKTSMAFSLTSPAFDANGDIPSDFTCDGAGTIPPLEIHDVPSGTASFALIVSDPDIPESVKQSNNIDTFYHWVVFNIPVTTIKIETGIPPSGIVGVNGAGQNKYMGPCPPNGEHRYIFTLYALPHVFTLPASTTAEELLAAINGGEILGTARLVGKYARTR
jgi:Raf kinase inhibitor-like YbhB/YbcL family protein